MHKYNASIGYDKALYREDILGSIAFARANSKVGIITENEFKMIERGLLDVMEEWKQGTFAIMPNDEDVRRWPTPLNLPRLTQRIRFILQTSVDWERSSERIPLASCTQVAAATSRSSVICACGYVTASVKSTANSLLSFKFSPSALRLKCKLSTAYGQRPSLITSLATTSCPATPTYNARSQFAGASG